MFRMEVEQMLVLNRVQVGQDRLKLVMIKRQILRNQSRPNDEKFFNVSSGDLEHFRSFKHDIDETHVMIGVKVRNINSLQVGENVSTAAGTEDSIKLKKRPLAAVHQNKVV